jgi:ABC-type bacteriocin/lantibiotic exporter with double-glycine peptidase domain
MSIFNKKTPFIEQMEQSECGLCCVGMVSSYFGYYPTLSELQKISGTGRDGLSMKDLRFILKELNMNSKAIAVKPNEIIDEMLPMISYWGKNHFVVLEKIKKGKYYILDPALGRRILTIHEFAEGYSNISLISVPNNKFQKNKKTNNWSYIYKQILNHKKDILVVTLFSAIVQLAGLTTPIGVQYSIDYIGENLEMNLLYLFGLILFIIFTGEFIFSFIRARILVYLKIKIDWSLMSTFFNKLLTLPFKFFQVRTFGDIILRANSNMMIREAISTQVITAILDIGLLFILTIYMFTQSPLLALVTIMFALLNVLILSTSAPKLSQMAKDELLKQTKVQSMQAETIYGIQSIRVSSMEERIRNDWEIKYKDQLETTKKKEILSVNINTISNSIETLARFTLLWLGIYLTYSSQLSLGAAIAFFTIVGIFFSPIVSLVNSFNSLFMVTAYLNRIMDVIGHDDEKTGTIHLNSRLNGDIKFENVSFSYGKSLVLKNIAIDIKAGEKIAIVGPSGAGKSTLGRLLVGLYEPTKGHIFFDKYNMNDLNKKSLRKQLSYVPQDVNLYSKSIFDNISYNIDSDDIDSEKIIHAAKIAQIHDEIISMPMKYETFVSENGLNLSGGQKQRIVLARALVNNPSIILLDEATSSLDNVNESKIEMALNSIPSTRIIIAHRLSTIKNANKIVFLENGEVLEYGDHNELMNEKGKYYCYYNEKYNREYTNS